LRDDVNVEETATRIRSIVMPFHPKGDVAVTVVRIQGKSR